MSEHNKSQTKYTKLHTSDSVTTFTYSAYLCKQHRHRAAKCVKLENQSRGSRVRGIAKSIILYQNHGHKNWRPYFFITQLCNFSFLETASLNFLLGKNTKKKNKLNFYAEPTLSPFHSLMYKHHDTEYYFNKRIRTSTDKI